MSHGNAGMAPQGGPAMCEAHAGSPTDPMSCRCRVPTVTAWDLGFLKHIEGEAGGSVPSNPGPCQSASSFFSRLWTASTLPAFDHVPLDIIDRELDATQRSAVCRAHHTQDVAAIQGLPGTGRSRVIAEVIRQQAVLGRRVLVVAPDGAALDVVIARFEDAGEVLPVRCLGRHETVQELTRPAASCASSNFHERMNKLVTCRAEHRVIDLEARLDRLHAVGAIQSELEGFEQQLETLRANPVDVEQTPASEPLREEHQKLTASLRQHDARLAELTAELSAIDKSLAESRASLSRVQQELAGRHWLMKLLVGTESSRREIVALSDAIAHLTTVRAESASNLAHAQSQRSAAVEAWRVTISEYLQHESERLRDRMQRILNESAQSAFTRQELHLRIAGMEAELATARQRVKHLPDRAGEIERTAVGAIRTVFARMDALGHDSLLKDMTHRGRFDLVIVDDVHMLSETQAMAALEFGSRWLLVGEPIAVANAPLSFWARVWHRLHDSVWREGNDRLACRLFSLNPAQRANLEIERVADAPDVELGLWSPTPRESHLAEVRFPSGTPIEHGMRFVYREMGELPVSGGPATWEEHATGCKARLSAGNASSSFELESGLSIGMDRHGPDWIVRWLDFAGNSGWTRGRAEEWIASHVRISDSGRSVLLDRSYRSSGRLHDVVSAVWWDGALAAARNGNGSHLDLEFVPVPTSPTVRGRGEHGGGRRLSRPRAGAGFEIDLADTRQRARLPGDLAEALPMRGLVNVPEANAIVHLLEDMAAEWTHGQDRPQSVAVLAAYPAQVELLRLVVHGSTELNRCPVPIRIESIGSFRHHEADVVIVSLTRSHDRRAVSFGAEPESMALAVTRARQKLILVGDPGTLSRRSMWDGPVEREDPASSSREKYWTGQLMRQLSGEGEPDLQLFESPR